MSVSCVIPARLNSSRFPGKLLKLAHGKTILQHTLEKAGQCPDFSNIFVATDHEEIANHVNGLGFEVIWTSSECQNGTERIWEALQKHPILQKSSYIVNLQGDHPCTEPFTLGAIIKALKSDEMASMATAVTPIRDLAQFLSPHTVKCVFDAHYNALYFSRVPIPYTRDGSFQFAHAHIGCYAYRTSFFQEFLYIKKSFYQECEDLEQLKVLENGYRIKIAIVKETVLGIDTPKDLETFKEILCQNISLLQAASFPPSEKG